MDTPVEQQLVVLLELALAVGVVDGEGLAPTLAHHRKHRHIAGAVCNVNHVGDRDAPVFDGHLCIDVDRAVAVAALVDLKDEARLDRVVDDLADLADLGSLVNRQLVLLQIMGGHGPFDKLAAENTVQGFSNGTAPDHGCQASRDNVVL